jgi:low temperature requirement protein LtrA
MTTSRAAELLRKPEQPQRVTLLELFFDLVFVFALSRISQRLLEDLTSERRIVLTEAGQTVLLLLALMMIWFATTWITNLYDPQQPEIQLLVLVTMFWTLVIAVKVPEAFGDRGLVFASAYVAIHMGRGLLLVPVLRGHEVQRRAVAVFLWFAVSAVPWIVGGFLPESPARGVLWTVALAWEYTGALLLFPAPWRGRAPTPPWPVAAEYVSDRYRQFFIIALGELILVTGAAFRADYLGASTVAFVVTFAITALVWRIYQYRAGELMPAAIAAAPEPSRLVRSALLAHLLMVAGIVAAAAGYELVIKHPLDHTDPAWIAVIIGGPVLFLVGRALFEYAVFARISSSRLIGAVVLAIAAPAMILLPPLGAAIAAALVLAGVAISDTIGAKGRPPELPSPPRSTT